MRKIIGILAVLAALGAVITSASVANAEQAEPAVEETAASSAEVSPLAEESCAAGHVCVWTEYNYQGARGESLCTTGAHPLGGFKVSGKNRCANKAVTFYAFGNAKGCQNPGDSSGHFPEAIEELRVGTEGSRC